MPSSPQLHKACGPPYAQINCYELPKIMQVHKLSNNNEGVRSCRPDPLIIAPLV